MRAGVLVFALICILGCCACSHLNVGTKAASTSSAFHSEKPPSGSASAPAKVDFSNQIKPILEARCQPCHFSGGKVYAKMPFDRAETIKTLGTKLFTRLKDENERRLIRDFLAPEQ